MGAYERAKDWFKAQQDSRNARGLSSVYVQPSNASAYTKATDWNSYQTIKRANNSSSSTTSSGSTSYYGTTTSSGSSTSSGSTSYYGTTTSSGSSTSSGTVSANGNTYNYSGGNRSISDYSEDKNVVFDATYSSVSANGTSLNLHTTSGTLTIANMKNKLVDIRDKSGNVLAKAYLSGNGGTLDGRPLNGYEFIIGSANSSNDIYAGSGGSTLWGNSGNVSDNLVGGAGVDTFYVGKNDGNDSITNASYNDRIDLYDVQMSDILSASESNGTITLGLNNGNTLSFQGDGLFSAQFSLADGSNLRYSRLTSSWQSA